MYEWTDERLEALSTTELKTLFENAQRKSADDLVTRCKALLEARDALKPARSAGPRSALKTFELDVSKQLAAVGKAMADKYDLSEATAKARSAGIKGFRAHRLLDARGDAKLGGMQRDGSVAIERYISYRLGNDTVYLGVFLAKDAPIDDHEFHVIAPAALLDGARPVTELRPLASGTHKQPAGAGLAFKDIESAAAAFEAALAKLAA